MNFLAHILVADQLAARQPAFALGAALPDLVGMVGLRLDVRSLPEDVAAGVACHHQADAAFHSDPAFLAGARSMRQALERAGCTAGTGRAVGHVGWELLLDGELARRPGVADLFLDALGRASAATGGLSPGRLSPGGRAIGSLPVDGDRWTGLVDHLVVRQWWRRYDEPDFVADRLHHRLANRPRLAFPQQQVPQVAQVLAVEQPLITDEADAVLVRVADRMQARGRGRGSRAAHRRS